MKLYPFLLLALLGTTRLAGQNPVLNIEQSTIIPDNSKAVLVAYTETDDRHLVTVKLLPEEQGSPEFILSRMLPSMDSTVIRAVEKPKKEEFLGYSTYGEHLSLFTIGEWQDMQRNIYRYRVNTHSLTHEKQELFTVTTEKKAVVNSGVRASTSTISFTPPKIPLGNSDIYPSQVLIKHSPNGRFVAMASKNEKTAKNTFALRVVDLQDGSVFMEKEFFPVNPRITSNVLLNDLIVTEEGAVFCIVHALKQFQIHKITPDATTTLMYADNKRKVHPLRLVHQTESNKLMMIGYYSERSLSKTDGLLTIQVDMEAGVCLEPEVMPITDAISMGINGLTLAGEIPEERPKDLILDNILQDERGDIYAIGQRVWTSSGGGFPGMAVPAGGSMAGGLQFSLSYSPRFGAGSNFGDIVIYKLDAEGKLIWSKGVAKDTQQSYTPFLVNNDLHILFNADKIRKNHTGTTILFKNALLKGSSLIHVSFDNKGTMSYGTLYNNKSDYVFEPGSGIVSGSSLLVAGVKMKQNATYAPTTMSVFMRMSPPAEVSTTAEGTVPENNNE